MDSTGKELKEQDVLEMVTYHKTDIAIETPGNVMIDPDFVTWSTGFVIMSSDFVRPNADFVR